MGWTAEATATACRTYTKDTVVSQMSFSCQRTSPVSSQTLGANDTYGTAHAY